jgi:hypothetical protein
VRIYAIACRPASPGYQASTIARTLSCHGIVTGLPVSRTTMVFGLASATASMTVVVRWGGGGG